MNQGFLYSLCWLCHQPLSIHLKEHVSVRLPPVPTLLVAIPYADFAYVIEARVLEGKFLFTLRCWRLGKVGHKALWGDFFSFSFFFSSSSNREYYNDLQRHVESKLCCKCLSLGPAKNHREKMQKV